MLLLAGQNRAFGYAAAASLAFHALVLSIQFPALREALAPPPEPPLVAHLAEPAAPPLPAPAPPPAPLAKPEQKKPEPRREAEHRKARPKPQPKPAPRPSPPPAPASPPEPQPIEQSVSQGELAPSEAPPVASAAPAPSAAPPSAAPAAAPRDPAAALDSFRRRLLDLAARHKRYPRVALDNGWTGDVVVRVEVAPGGEVSGVALKTSSGYRVLDEQALEMFRKAAAEVRVPAELRGQPFSVEVRAIYDLQDRPG